jgi:hypothetical protein
MENTTTATPQELQRQRQFASLFTQLETQGNAIATIALFDIEGNWTPAKIVTDKYKNSQWVVLNASGQRTGQYLPYRPANRNTQAKRGFVEGYVFVSAQISKIDPLRWTVPSIVPKSEIGTGTPISIISTDRYTDGIDYVDIDGTKRMKPSK